MRRLVVALVAAIVLALALTGCGGGGEEAKTPAAGAAPAAGTAAPPPPPGSAQPVAEGPNNSPEESVNPSEAFPADRMENMPKPIVGALQTKQAFLLFYYDSGSKATNDVRAELDAALSKYRGLIDLVAYDLAANTEAKGAKGETASQAVLLANQLGVSTVPYILVVDRDGKVSWRGRGFYDRSIIEREIIRATQ